MDWRSIQFDWNHARSFLVTATEGSFSAAGRALNIAQPTVGRHIAALEEELGVMLFERIGTGLSLTPTGVELLEHVRAMSESANRLSLVAAGQNLSLEGSITLSASEIISTHLLPPVLVQLRQLHPKISIELLATNTPSDLRRREADIAIRSFQPKDPELIARKLRDQQAFLYATPAYLEHLNNPQTPEELSQADFIGFDRGPALIQGLNALGLSLKPDNFPILTQNQLVQWELTKRGAAIGLMLAEIGDLEPTVQRALPQLPPIQVPMWLTCHQELQTSKRVRTVFDLLADHLTPPP